MTLRLMLCAFIRWRSEAVRIRVGFRERRPIPRRWNDGSDLAPDRPRLRDRQGPPDYTVYCGGWDVGRIYETRSAPESLRWSMTVNGPMTRSDRVATLKEAKAQF